MDSDLAEQHLRVIRELMERSTVYRTVSVPAALFAGISGASVAFLVVVTRQTFLTSAFVPVWLLVFFVSAGANLFILGRTEAIRNGQFISQRMRTALAAIAPALLIAAMITVRIQSAALLAVGWIACYGLALLSTRAFAPRSIVVLGWTFLVTAIVAYLVLPFEASGPYVAHTLMGVTFGFYHIIYSLAVVYSSGWRKAAV